MNARRSNARTSAARRGRARAALAALALAAVLGVSALLPGVALAHAFLERSDPVANAVLPSAPSSFRIWFTEPIEKDYSKASLFDSSGNKIETSPAQVTDDKQLTLPLPANLPNGTYTVQWRNISAADGHAEAGYIPFTIGTQADIVQPIVPEITTFNQPPSWLTASVRWLSLLGEAVALGGLICWLWVLRPATRRLDDEPAGVVRDRAYSLALVGVVIAAGGSLLALSVQSAGSGSGYGPSGMIDVALDTRWGTWWLARVVLLVLLAGALSFETLWEDPPRTFDVLLALGIGALALLPFSLAGHASAQPQGKPTAIATDWLHLAGAAVWVGGLIALLVALVYGTRRVAGPERRAVWAESVNRFTTLAIVSIVVLAATGLYSAWLQVGNLTALRETAYGQALIVKLVLIAPMLLLGLVNNQVLGPRMVRSAQSGRHFSRTIAAEAMLGIGVLFAVGILTSLAPARDELVATTGATQFHWSQDGLHAALYLSPGAVGYNRYTVDVAPDTGNLPSSAQVLLRFTPKSGVEGVREVALPHLSGARYEASGSELSVVGNWNLELIVRLPDTNDWRAATSVDVQTTPPASRLPGAPPRFSGANAAIAVLFAGLAVFAMVVGWRLRDQLRERLTVAGFGLALLLTAGVIFAVTQAPKVEASLGSSPPEPMTAESVAAGRELFAANCVRCHGDDAKGDGPDAPTLKVPPADLTIQHVDQHSDQDLHWWIQKGIGDNMPSFEGKLTDSQIWHLVNYIRSLRHPIQ